MAKVKAHIREARQNGPEAGFNLFWDSLNTVTGNGTRGLDTVNDLRDEVVSAGGGIAKRGRNKGDLKNREAAIAWYCNHYADELEVPATKPKRSTRKATPAKSSPTTTESETSIDDLAALLAEKLGIALPDTDDEDDEDDDTEVVNSVPTRRVKRTTHQEPETETTEYPRPRDPDAECTQGKLWFVNHNGPANGVYLVAINEDGDILAGGDAPLTAGEVYDLINDEEITRI